MVFVLLWPHPKQMTDNYFIRQLPENKFCADCRGPSPRWASTNLGIFLCISCSGVHRKLGTHISQVRSITLDTWTASQIAHFTRFGNSKAAQYFEACLPPDFRRPHASESTKIERFIREKYENKRYITVENGGLGGLSSSRENIRGSYVPAAGTLGQRPYQPNNTTVHMPARYEDVSVQRSWGQSSTSYGSRFGSKATTSNTSGNTVTRTTASGKFNANRGSLVRTTRGNAIERANTLKELINMGFQAGLASRAVEAAQGDLEKAVDWILLNNAKDQEHKQPPQNVSRPRLEEDLLNFEDKKATSQPASRPVPKAVNTEPLFQNATKKVSTAEPVVNSFTDFADFGAFESALPAKQSGPSAQSATNGSLGTSLASLYSRKPTQPRSPVQTGIHHHLRMQQQPKNETLAQLSPKVSPKLPFERNNMMKIHSPLSARKPALKASSPSSIDLGLTDFTALANKKSPQHTISKVENSSLSISDSTYANLTREKHTTSKTSTPPPPPMQRALEPRSEEYPPPATTPPGSSADEVLGALSTNPIEENNSSLPLQDTKEAKGSQPPTESAEPEPEPEEDVDPFAALSMMALTSASLKKAPKKAMNKTMQKETVDTDETTKESAAPTNIGSSGIDLDDFFG